MTVPIAPRFANFIGNGTTGPFTFNFPILLENDNVTPDIIVTQIDALGDQTVLNYPQDFSFVPLSLGQAGGIITTIVAIPNDGSRFFVEGDTPVDQDVPYRNEGASATEKFENSFDKLTLIAQESGRTNALAIRIPNSDPAGIVTILPSSTQRANMAMLFDATGNVVAGAVPTVPVSAPMVPVVQASSVSAALALLGGLSTTTAASTYLTITNAASTYATITNLALKANIASPAFTGAPTAPTPTAGDVTTKLATMANFAQGANGSSLIYVSKATASNSAALVFTLPAGFSKFELQFENLVPATTGTVRLQVSTDGGATWLATGYPTALVGFSPGGIANGGNASDPSMALSSTDTVNSASSGCSGFLYLSGVNTAAVKDFCGISAYPTSSTFAGAVNCGAINPGVAVNAVRILTGNGANLSSGSATLWAKRDS